MADATRSWVGVKRLSGTPLALTTAVAVNHGEFVYIHTDSTALLTDADAAASVVAPGCVISHTPNLTNDTAAAIGEQVDIAMPGSVIRAWTDLVTGSEYFCSTNSGEICPRADLITGDFVKRVGVAMNQYDLLILPDYYNATALS